MPQKDMCFAWDLLPAFSNIGIPFHTEPDIFLSPDGSSTTKLPSCFWTAFSRACQACYGDFSGIIDIVQGFLDQGLIVEVVADPKKMIEAFKQVVSFHKGFRSSITNFSQFCRAMSKQLALCGAKTDSATLVIVDQHYNTFMECDRDGSGGVSLEEYIIFCSKQGVPASMAETMFFQADIDGNGEFTFR